MFERETLFGFREVGNAIEEALLWRKSQPADYWQFLHWLASSSRIGAKPHLVPKLHYMSVLVTIDNASDRTLAGQVRLKPTGVVDIVIPPGLVDSRL